MKKRITFSVATLILAASLLAVPVSASRKATEKPTTTSSSVVTSTTETEEITVSASEANRSKNAQKKNSTTTTATTATTKTTTNASTSNINKKNSNSNGKDKDKKNSIVTTTTESATITLDSIVTTTAESATITLDSIVTTTAESATITLASTVSTTESATIILATTVTTTAEPATTMPVSTVSTTESATTTSTTTFSTTVSTTEQVTTIPEMPPNALWVPRWENRGQHDGAPIELFVGDATQENVDQNSVVLDFDLTKSWDTENIDCSPSVLKKKGVFTTTENDWFLFGHSYRDFTCLDLCKIGDFIYLTVDGELLTFVVQVSQSGKLSAGNTDIWDSNGTSIIKNLPTDDVMSIKLITCYLPLCPTNGCDDRWVVIATATE